MIRKCILSYTVRKFLLIDVVTQKGAEKLLRSKDGPKRIPVDGYPFVDWNGGLRVYVNMGLKVSVHSELNRKSDKDRVSKQIKSSPKPITNATGQECNKLQEKHNVVPSSSWGSLGRAGQLRWKELGCDRAVMGRR